MRADIRSALRQAALHPWFFAGATLSLAIGMSVATAVFSVVDAALFRPLPFPSPDRLVHIAETLPQRRGTIDMTRIPAKQFMAARADAKALGDIAAWAPDDLRHYRAATSGDDGRAISGARVTVNFFHLLGVRPMLGRDFDPGEGFGEQRVAMLSHAYWTARLGADSSIVGKEILLGGVPHRVIGVMPQGFGYPPVDAWFPLPLRTIEEVANSRRDDDWPAYNTVGRLAPGASIEELSAELAVIYKRVYGNHEWRNARSSRAQPFAEYVVQPLREQLQLWTAIAILVGILCAVNFATVSLARGMRRRGELAVRAAMGASSRAIVRLLVTEAVLTAAAGGLLAIVLGAWMLHFVQLWFADGAMVILPHMSWSTMAFAVGATTLVGMVFAAAPAIDLSRMDVRSRLQSDGAQTTERRGTLRGRRLLVGLQLALALTAVAVVAALVDADRRHWAVDVGVDYRGLLIGSLSVEGRDRLDSRAVLERVRAVPGVTNASLFVTRAVTAWTDDAHRDAFGGSLSEVSPDYFNTVGVRVVAGRMPTDAEVADSAAVALLSAYTAKAAFGSAQGALGRRLHLKRPGKGGSWVTVIGVLPEFGGRALFMLSSTVYTVRDLPSARGTLVMRVLDDTPRASVGVARAAQSFGPRLALTELTPARTMVEGDAAARRGRTVFVVSIGALALLLAVIGMYGLTAYNTEVRAREFGIRIALGAGAARLAHALVDELVPLAGVGVLVALLAAARLSAFLDDRFRSPLAEQPVLQFQVAPAVGAAAALLLVVALGVAAPLWRVLHMDVMRVIRTLAVLAAILPATAQAQARQGEIAGTVTDSASGPLPDVDVFLRGAARRAHTDSAGRYRFADLDRGSYTVIARKIGYRFEEADVVVRAGASVRQDFTMTRRVILPGIDVTARAECPLGPTITGFFCRQQRASGTFLDYPEIDYFGHTYTAEVFRHLRGFRVETRRTPAGWMEPVPVRRYCTMYLVDGLVVRGWDAVPVTTNDVTAMEVYLRPDTVPPEIRREMRFHPPAGLGANARDCDAVVIWTRRANR